MPNLERLQICTFLSDKAAPRPPKTFLNDDHLELLAGAQQLRGLDIEDSPDVTDAGLQHLRALTNLQQLRLERVPVSVDGLQHLKGLDKLESVAVFSPKITPQQLKDFKAAMPNVQITP